MKNKGLYFFCIYFFNSRIKNEWIIVRDKIVRDILSKINSGYGDLLVNMELRLGLVDITKT